MTSSITLPCPTIEGITGLYRTHLHDLQRVRDELRQIYRRRVATDLEQSRLTGPVVRRLVDLGIWPDKPQRMRPQFDDVDAEVTYLLLRETRPDIVVEISPCDGWSTNWILRALRDNGRGVLHSYDIHDRCLRNVDPELARDRWQFHLGDVTRHVASLPERIDYLFVDSDHSAAFARWYLEHVWPRVRPGAVVSIDDVFHFADPGQFDGEGRVVIDWLAEQRIPWITFAPAHDRQRFDAIKAERRQLGIERLIHDSERNTAVFFVMPDR